MIADAMAAAATVGRLSAVAEQTEKREKTLQTLKETVKTEIADAVKRSAEQEKQKTVEDKNRRGRSWRDVAAGDRPQLPRYSWSVDRTVFLTPVNQALRKQHLDKSKFGLSLNEALRQVAGPEAQSEQCVVESLIRTGLGLFKVQLAGAVIRPLLNSGVVTVGAFREWKVERMRESSAPSIVLMGVDRSLSDEQVAQGVMRGSRGLLLEVLRGRLGHVRAKRLFSAAKGASSAVGSSSPSEAQPTRNVRLYCGQEVLDNLVSKGFVKIDWDIVRCRPYEPPRFFCKKCGRMGGHSTEFHRSLEVTETTSS